MGIYKKSLGSFKDPSGFVFIQNDLLYRQINISYKDNYDQLMASGLYEKLVNSNLLISHEEVDINLKRNDSAYKIIKPEVIEFISYPYEWCFSQLRDAALLTLHIQKTAIEYGMSLKDSSAYNIQFKKNKPVFIDTLFFEKYHDGSPWVAYKQFCQHFLAPLSLAAYKDFRLNKLVQFYLDGIPLDLASTLLPFNSFFNYHLLIHIHLHAKAQKKYSSATINKGNNKFGKLQLLGLIDSLEVATKKLKWMPGDTNWANYYEDNSYSADSFEHKKTIVSKYLDEISAKHVWDLGANTGVFSKIASNKGIKTISFDNDPGAVEKNYTSSINEGNSNILPLNMDLTNPNPSIGWGNEERMSLFERCPTDTVLALALIHHLAISNNLPLREIASFMSSICIWLIIEFIPKTDQQVEKLLSSREDVFDDYNQQNFESEFSQWFLIKDSVKIRDSDRTIYLMNTK